MEQEKSVLYAKDGAVAVVTINRPKALNALNTEVLEELNKIIEEIKQETDIRIVLFTGAGRAFVAGADIAEMVGFHGNPGAGRAMAEKGSAVFRKIELLEQVTIAAINGFALGGGCELAMSCDMRIASENAKFGQPEVLLGITPGFCGTQRLPRLVGQAKAKEMILTGDAISAVEAERIGLVNKVVKEEDLMEEVRKFMDRILKNAPTAVKYANLAIKKGEGADMDTGMTIESSLFDMCFYTPEQKEGMTAFLEKRKPNFKS